MKLDNFINRPVLSTVISILIVILGVIGLVSLPIETYPDIAPPTVMVSATYTGANAETTLKSVVVPLEESINGVENMDYMTSSATNTGSANVQIVFKQGTDPDMAAVNVQNKVSSAQGLLPAEVTKIGVTTRKRQNSMLLMFSLYDKSGKYDQRFLENYAKINIIPQVQRVKGVGEAFVMGADYSMRIWLKPEVMAQYHLMPSDVTAALSQQNIEAAPGSIGERENQTFEYTLRYRGRLENEKQFENIVIRATPDGQILRLKDIARVELGRLTYAFRNKVDGHPGVMSIAFQVAGSNATQVVQDIEKVLDNAKKDLPAGIDINIAQSVNDFLFASIHEVIKTLIEAFILVFIVVYIFLQDLRSTLIPAIAIPVALIGTFFFLKILGFTINLLTLNAMVLAIAIVVDDAIVVVEGVHAKLDQGYTSSRKASIDAMRELGSAIVSITLVMMAVFIPVSFIPGTSGVFYKQFGLTMAIAIGLSALNALTLSPALCAVFLKPVDKEKAKKQTFINRFHTAFNTTYETLLESYKKRVLNIIHHPYITVGIAIVGIAVLVVLMKVTPTGFVPNEDTGTVMGTVDLPEGTSQDRTEVVLDKIDSLIQAIPAIKSHTQISGYSFLGGQGSNNGSFVCKLKDWDERSLKESSDIIAGTLYLNAKKYIKDAQVLFFGPPMIPGYSVTNGIQLNLQDKTGGSIDSFYKVAQDFIAHLNERPELSQAQTSFRPNYPQYMIDIDAAECMKAGLTPNDILTTLQGYYGGLYASNFNRFGKLYRVMVQAERSERTNLESLKKIKVRNGSEMAPITQFITLHKVYGPSSISRFNMYTSITVNANPGSGYTSGQAIKAVEEVAKKYLPTGYSYEYSGLTREEQANSGNTTAIIFALCIVFIYLLLSALYESYLLPLAVILSVPFGLAGSFIFIQLLGLAGNILPFLGATSNNIYVQISLIMLIGLLAKNAILIIQFAVERRQMGMSITWAAVLGAGARLRPIIMTSLAMIVGLMPLMFAMGVGANGDRSLGAAAVGGMLIGVLCQIFIVPSLFVIFEYLQEKIKPMVWDDIDNSDISGDIKQYTK